MNLIKLLIFGIVLFLGLWQGTWANPCEEIIERTGDIWPKFYKTCLGNKENVSKNAPIAIKFFLDRSQSEKYPSPGHILGFFTKIRSHRLEVSKVCEVVNLLGKEHKTYDYWFNEFNCNSSPKTISVSSDNTSSLMGFNYSEWLDYYRQHFLFFLHIALIITVLISFSYSLTFEFARHNRRLKEQPLMVEYYVQKISRRYYLFAEMFLLTGLAGAALAIQGIFDNSLFDLTDILKGSTQVAPSILEVRKGVAFSAAGIVLAVFCYVLRTILLLRYQTALEDGFEFKAENESSHATELKELHKLLERFLSQQTDSIIPMDKILDQIEALDKTLNSNVVQKNFTKELEQLLNRLAHQTETRLEGIADTVNSAIGLIQESRENLDKQFAHSQNFLMRLEDLEAGLNRSGNEIANRMERISKDIQSAHQPFLDSVQAIHLNLTDTTQQIIHDLKTAHETLRDKFVEQVKAVVQIHQSDVDQKNVIIQSAMDKTVGRLTHSFEKMTSDALAILLQGIEKTNKELYQNVSEEHATYMQKIEKYQELLSTFKSGVDTRIEEASKLFEVQVQGALQYYQKVLKEYEGNNKKIQEQLFQSTKKLQKTISLDFVETIHQSADKIENSFENYLAKTQKFSEISKVRSEQIEETLADFGFSPRKSRIEKIKNWLKNTYEKIKDWLRHLRNRQ
ncbi:hypothetical protein [Candidatus Parabeggiatoa sp. HSG14]|uniref:hypothetical protein n=1 Tax=Candidatus Parabeggiatoa sp. HSG14 TaxID=3055593 RepID=UPI0025A6EDFF|nr:hypothetical protein [Thiotrichales bacterium HSG14]